MKSCFNFFIITTFLTPSVFFFFFNLFFLILLFFKVMYQWQNFLLMFFDVVNSTIFQT